MTKKNLWKNSFLFPDVPRIFIIIYLIKNTQTVEKYGDIHFLLGYINIRQLFLSNLEDVHHNIFGICNIKKLEAILVSRNMRRSKQTTARLSSALHNY